MKLIPVPTRGEGDCAFHAIFGKPNGRQYVCDEVKALREKVAQVIEETPFINNIWPSIEEAIKELIRPDPQNITLDKQQFPRLTALRANYDKENEDFGELDDLAIRKEYAQIMRTPGNWSLACELSVIAHACNKTVVHFETSSNTGEIVEFERYNSGQQQLVNVYFNGRDHYQAMEPESTDNLQGEGEHEARGLKDTLHGNIYQLKLLMLFLHRGSQQDYEFRLATEMEAAQKFDDLVFKYENKDKKLGEPPYIYRYIQAKHKSNDDEVISDKDLLTGGEGEFSLQKYFISYQKIKNNPEFIDGKLGEFCICTNIGFDFDKARDVKRTLKLISAFEKVTEADNILQAGTLSAVKYRFQQGDFPGKTELYTFFKQNSERVKLAKALLACMQEPKKKVTKKSPIFATHYDWLVKNKVIDDKTRRVMLDFLTSTTLSKEAQEFRVIYRQGKNAVDPLVRDEDITDFLQHLVFAVNQPNEVELGELIEKKLNKEFNLIDSKFIYTEFLNATLDWMKDKQGTFLTADSVGPFFSRLRQKVHHLALIGPTLDYQKKLEAFDLTFTPSEEINRFLSGANQVMIYDVKSVRLGSIQVYQTLAAAGYEEDDSYVFIHLKTALRLEDIVRSAFAKGQLLVLSCDNRIEEPKSRELIQRLLEHLSRQENKKIIFITAASQILSSLINNPHIKPIPAKIDFKSLTESSQKKLQDYQVTFQGQETSLITLVENLDNLIDTEILAELIKSKLMAVGKPLDPAVSYYIDRTFRYGTQIRDVCLLNNEMDFFAISGEIDKNSLSQLVGHPNRVRIFSEEESDPDRPSRYIIVNESDVVAQFQQICVAHPEHSVHLLGREQGKFIWQQSHGSVANLRQYLEIENVDALQTGYAVLSAVPGMGKSTLLSNLMHQLKKKPELWAIKVNLLEVENRLKVTEFTGIKNIINFFIPGETALAKKILEHRLNHSGEIALLLDGFDEIQASTQEKVIQLLLLLKSTKAQHIVVATRTHMQEQLEDTLSIFSHTLKPFDEKDRYEFFARFWQKELGANINQEKVIAYAAKLMEIFKHSTNDQTDKFIGIPLQAELLAIAFLEDFKKYYAEDSSPNFPSKLSLHTLYQQFIQTKYQLFLEEKYELKECKHLSIINSLIRNLNEQHQLLAFDRLFPQFKVGSKKFEIDNSLINAAGIARFSSGKWHFIHQTFAEYFTAEFLVDGLSYASNDPIHQQRKKILIQHIFKVRNNVVHSFIEELVSNSKSGPLEQIWKEICACNLLPANDRTFTIVSKKTTRRISIYRDINWTNWPQVKKRLESKIDLKPYTTYPPGRYGPEIKEIRGDFDTLCSAFLNIAASSELAELLIFFKKLKEKTNFFDVVSYSNDRRSRYIGESPLEDLFREMFLHYIKMSRYKGKLFNNELIKAFNPLSRNKEWNLPKLIDKVHYWIKQKDEVIAAFNLAKKFKKYTQHSIEEPNVMTETFKLIEEFKDYRLSLLKHSEFDLLHLFSLDFPQAKPTRVEIDEILNETLRSRYSRKSKSRFHVVDEKIDEKKVEIGSRIVNSFKVITPNIATVFTSVVSCLEVSYLELYNGNGYLAEGIWEKVLLPLLSENNIDLLVKESINSIALLKIFAQYMQYLSTYKEMQYLSVFEEKKYLFTFTSSSVQNLLTLTEATLSREELNEDMLAIGVTQLYLLNKIGFHIIDVGKNTLLILDANSEFEYELQLKHKDLIQKLLLFKADSANSQQAFEDECRQTLESILFGQTKQAAFQEKKLLENNHVQQDSALFSRGIKRARSLESFSLGNASENRFLTAESTRKKIKRAAQPSDNRQDNRISSSQGVKRLSPEEPAEEAITPETPSPGKNQDYKKMRIEETMSTSNS
jgi:hypothetical protein